MPAGASPRSPRFRGSLPRPCHPGIESRTGWSGLATKRRKRRRALPAPRERALPLSMGRLCVRRPSSFAVAAVAAARGRAMRRSSKNLRAAPRKSAAADPVRLDSGMADGWRGIPACNGCGQRPYPAPAQRPDASPPSIALRSAYLMRRLATTAVRRRNLLAGPRRHVAREERRASTRSSGPEKIGRHPSWRDGVLRPGPPEGGHRPRKRRAPAATAARPGASSRPLGWGSRAWSLSGVPAPNLPAPAPTLRPVASVAAFRSPVLERNADRLASILLFPLNEEGRS